MKSTYRNLIFLVFPFLIVTFFQKTPNSFAALENLQYLYQTWFNSYEEQESRTESIETYRPEGFKEFPPSRFRNEYIFKEDGSCQWLVLHPADAHYLKSGTWEVSPDDDQVILIYDQQHSLQKSFRIIEIQKDLLRIRSVVFLEERRPEN
ncbi:MAG: hypothetical protein A2Y00_04750 [Omnitrophica WOR_2 bacterium GWF2_43_52]|nr:MAG: hypothetical protein A2062_06875 [Omnitrophica WOR_2 bacterium GWA2_44_7]OGX15152.1 MAG: hypothetical protein A2Y01_03630 [Omnitrophica WOR_2 bacterium GWC2_44_8]OGX20416.1 MAG: hypothetical protein A2Y00_04750 [Omnitrophica WOR_2 bacterium GWF2_43_52]OGX56623.1 MAG: hypothetical protein A2460_05270 [Omnitrophica WOR_2 bacterium RIFOXYC2_FULL_43_9]HAH20686.1 hypothetical protein [Candidatus Omnitrophota bacterium]